MERCTSHKFSSNIARLSEFHYGEKNTLFDMLANDMMVSHHQASRSSQIECAHLRVVYELMAQNSIARRRLTQAAKECDLARMFAVKSGVPVAKMGRIHLLKAEIVHRQGAQPSAILFHLNLAYMAFTEEGNDDGVAESLRELGYQNARNRRFELAHKQLSRSIDTYRRVGNVGAVVVTKGTLAGIFHMQGDVNRTRLIYEECLTYWSRAGHKRWIIYFQGKLRALKNNRC